eukprot:6610905-Karenia_brevis.AAC.1
MLEDTEEQCLGDAKVVKMISNYLDLQCEPNTFECLTTVTREYEECLHLTQARYQQQGKCMFKVQGMNQSSSEEKEKAQTNTSSEVH